MTHREAKMPSSLDEDLPALQFNTRVSLRIRRNLDDYLEYMKRPLRQRPPETEDWPTNLTSLTNEALEIWLAEHQRRLRKGPRPDTLTPKEKQTP